jgi:hypothetical protein
VKRTARHPTQLKAEAGLKRRALSPLALGFLLLFAVTAYAGARIVAFEGLESRIGTRLAVPSQSANQQARGALEAVSAWTHTPSVAAAARRFMVKILVSETPGDSAAIEDALGELAQASPTSTPVWQALVAFYQARGGPIEGAFPAFRMSALTGSHEGYFMVQRGLFGLEHWSKLSDADRRTVIRDVVGTALVAELNRGGNYRFRPVLAKKAEGERADIRTAFTASGLASNDVLKALGL